MLYYVISTNRHGSADGDCTRSGAGPRERTDRHPDAAPSVAAASARVAHESLAPSLVLEGFTWLYLIWSILPIALAVLFSFNNGKSQSYLARFQLALVRHRPDQLGLARSAVAPGCHPDAQAVGLHHGDHRADRCGIRDRDRPLATRTCVGLQFRHDLLVRRPRADLRCRSCFVFTRCSPSSASDTLAADARGTGTSAGRRSSSRRDSSGSEGRTRRRRPIWVLTIGSDPPGSAADAHAPAIFASGVLVFSGVIDDFVIVDLLNSNASNTPMSVLIYSNAARRQRRPGAECAGHDHARHVLRGRDRLDTSRTAG